jgi:hypothetical protein
MEEKFRWLAQFVLDDEQIDGLLEMVWHFEDVPSVARLTDLVSG